MKMRHVLILSVILVVLVALAFIKNRHQPEEIVTKDEPVSLDLSFDAGQVARIELGKAAESTIVKLEKSGEEWTIPTFSGAAADEAKIEALFKDFQDVKGEFRGAGESLFGDFGLTEDEAFHVRFFDGAGQPLLQVEISQKVIAYDKVFLRRSESDEIYHAEVNFFSRMGIYKDPKEEKPENHLWAKRQLVKIDADQVEGITTKRFEDGAETVSSRVVRKTDSDDLSRKRWSFEGAEMPFGPDAEKIKELIRDFETRPASKVLELGDQDFGLAAPQWQMTIDMEGGEEIIITAGNVDPDTKGSYVQVSTEPVVFLYPEYYMKHFDIDNSRFFSKNPLGIIYDKIESITVRTPAGEAVVSPRKDTRSVVSDLVRNLENIKIERLLNSAEGVDIGSGQLHSIEIQKEGLGEPVILDVEGRPLEGGREFKAQKRGTGGAFVISESVFKNFFGNLEGLKPAEEAVSEA